MNQICMAEIPANILEYYKIGLASVQLSQKFCMFKKKKKKIIYDVPPTKGANNFCLFIEFF